MVYRKGELNTGRIDSGWPHQVALRAEAVRGRTCTIIDRFCRGLSICSRHQYYRKDDREFIVYCFAEQRDAEYFQMHFGGELMTAATRPPRYPKVPRRTI